MTAQGRRPATGWCLYSSKARIVQTDSTHINVVDGALTETITLQTADWGHSSDYAFA